MKNEQYFTANPTSADEEFSFTGELVGKKYQFYSNNGVFAKNFLDFGTLTLINTVAKQNLTPKRILDLGTGYGPIALFAANQYPQSQIIASDINQRALLEAKRNFKVNGLAATVEVVESDLFAKIDQDFDLILTNPPIRAGKKVINQLVEQSWEHLIASGQLILVVQRKQGEPSLKKKMTAIYGNCEILKRNKGYYILRAQKL